MTLNEIQAVGYQHGLPKDYPLRGTKAQQARQVMNFFQRGVDYESIRTCGVSESEHLPQLKADRDAVLIALASELL